MKKTLIIIITALMAFAASSYAGPKKKTELKEVTFSVHLHCANCVKKVQENISFEKGVKDLHVCLEDQIVSVKYDAAKTSEDVLKVTVDVTNTGKVAGKESVLLFSTDLYASSIPDVRRLRAFEKVELESGETKTVEFELSAKDLAFVNYYGQWTLEKGDFVLSCGTESVEVACAETVVWDTPNID